MNITFEPDEPGVQRMKVQRKKSLRSLTDEYCDTIKKERLTDYKDQLKSQQESFLEEKSKTNQWIEQEMAKLKISDEDIEKYAKIKNFKLYY